MLPTARSSSRRTMKPSILMVLSSRPGKCADCRHSNQGTVDFGEGHLVCAVDQRPKRADQTCDVQMSAPRTVPIGAPASWKKYFASERFDGSNSTYGITADFRVLAPDADQALRAALGADTPVQKGGAPVSAKSKDEWRRSRRRSRDRK